MLSYDTVVLAVLCLGFALPCLILAFAFVVGLLERQPVVMFRDATVAAAPDAYMAAALRTATGEHGFAWRAAGRHVKFARLWASLLVSPDAATLAIVGSGTIVGIDARKTILLSRLDDGGVVISVDEAGTGELDPLTRRLVLPKASFGELWGAHAAAIAAGPARAVPVPAAAWADVDAVYAARVERMVAAGRARYADRTRTAFRFTVRGSFKACVVYAVRQIVASGGRARGGTPAPGFDVIARTGRARPAAAGVTRRPTTPLRLDSPGPFCLTVRRSVRPMAHQPSDPSQHDPFRPPATPCEVRCLHCGEDYESWQIEWRECPGGAPIEGTWCCPTPGCGGVGFGFDILPVDPDWADEDGERRWSYDDDEDEDDDLGISIDDEDDEEEPAVASADAVWVDPALLRPRRVGGTTPQPPFDAMTPPPKPLGSGGDFDDDDIPF